MSFALAGCSPRTLQNANSQNSFTKHITNEAKNLTIKGYMKDKEKNFSAKEIDTGFIKDNPCVDIHKVAIFYSKDFKTIFGEKMSDAHEGAIEGIVKISKYNKTIYRKYIAWNKATEGNVKLSTRSLALLGMDDYAKVTITKSNWFAYMWHNNDSTIRVPFKLAFWSILLTLLTGLCSLAVSLFDIKIIV